MNYNLDRNQQILSINSISYNYSNFQNKELPHFAKESEFGYQVYVFIKDWFADSPTMVVHTSGSTGIPKKIHVEKSKMTQSAKLTCQFLKLEKNNTALLCIPTEYIGGKMMIVRSLIANMNLYISTPSGNPLSKTDQNFDFAAMTPMQVYNSLQYEDEIEKLAKIKSLIIGGGAVDNQLENKLKHFSNEIYSSYGMTETLSHIALRKLSGEYASSHYIAFPSVKLSLSEDKTLIIEAPMVAEKTIYTNDIAEIYEDGSFNILGRKDNIINSGGIKIQIEAIENLLKPILKINFAICSLLDSKYGEIIVLVVENKEGINKDYLKKKLPPYYFPKKIIELMKIPLTKTGKIDRASLKNQISQLCQE